MRKIYLILVVFFSTSCGQNLFKDGSNQTSDDALYFSALILIDQQDYLAAITKLQLTSAGYQAKSSYIQTLAGAQAGYCGQNFLSLITSVTGGAGTAFQIFESVFTTRTIHPSFCYSSQLSIEGGFGNTTAARTTDLNFFMAILGISKMGTYIRSNADTDQDGVVDAGFDSCSAASISDADVIQIGTGLALLINNISAVSSSLSGSGAVAAVSNLATLCAGFPGNPCAVTDPNSPSWDANAIKAIRSLLKSNTYGIENCNPPEIGCCP